MTILINYYSRSGNNKLVAEELASRLGADIEGINSKTKYSNLFGIFKMVIHGRRKKPSRLELMKKNPAGYDLVVLCSPVWAGKLSAPARSYLQKYAKTIKKLAFLSVCGGGEDGNPDTSAEVKDLAGKTLICEMELNTNLLLPEADRNDPRKVMAVHLKKQDLEQAYKDLMKDIENKIKKIVR